MAVTWEVSSDTKLGPCPEKWWPLLPTDMDDYSLLQKCILFVDVKNSDIIKPEINIMKMMDAVNACSNIFPSGLTSATIYRPEDIKELNYFLTHASKRSMNGMIDIIINEGIPYDHLGRHLQEFGTIITKPAYEASNKECGLNSPDMKIVFANCDSIGRFWCQYKAKPVMTDYECGGWFKADQGSNVYCYFVYRYQTTARNARNICRENKAQLVTIDNIGEWSYITHLAEALAPNAKDRSLLLGYTRCSTDPPEWRTLDGNVPPINYSLPNSASISDEICCLELNFENKTTYNQMKMQDMNVELGSLYETVCNKRVSYFMCKKQAKGRNQ